MTALTKKHAQFKWTDEHQKSFEMLKASLTAEPILKLPEMGKPFQLFTDASNNAIGCLLTQEEDSVYKPVYYISHQLTSSQQKWSVIEKECYAILFGIEKFRAFLEGTKFQVFTDHHPLKYINSAENKNAKLQRWATKISSYGADIQFIKGRDNVHADFLSRLSPENIPKFDDHETIETRLDDVAVIDLDRVDLNPSREDEDDSGVAIVHKDLKIHEAQQKNKHLSNIIKSLKDNGAKPKYRQKYIIIDDVLYHVNTEEELRIVVPDALQEAIIRETHEGMMGGHTGRDKTFDIIRRRYFWKNLAVQVYSYVGKCIKCNQQNLQMQTAPLQEAPIARFPFERISIDLAGPYPESELGNRFCFTITDQFSGWVEAFPIPNKKSITLARILVNQIFARYSWCRVMVSDNGTEMVNDVMRAITQMGHIHHIKTSSYHPQSNTYAERPHRTMVDCLAKVAGQTNWDLYLPSFCAAYNSSISASRKFSPFFLLYHREPILPLDTILKDRERYYGEDFLPQALERMHQAYRIVRRRLKEQGERNREYIDKKRRAKDVVFGVGDPVYVRNHQRTNKLDAKWDPHYRITVQTGPTSFIIQNQLTGRTRRVHANDIRLADLSSVGTASHKTNVMARRARFVINGNDADTESENSEEEEEIVEDTSSNSDEQDARHDELTKVLEEPSAKSSTDTSQTGRPQRSAKLDAMAKIKAMQISNIDTAMDDLVNKKLADLFFLVADHLNT